MKKQIRAHDIYESVEERIESFWSFILSEIDDTMRILLKMCIFVGCYVSVVMLLISVLFFFHFKK